MPPIFQDRVKETTTTTGTGTVTLAGAVAGFRTFTSALATGDVVTYCIEDGTNWEVGEGTFTTSGTTLSRTLVIASSNAGSLVSLTGTNNVFLTQSARDVYPTLWGPGASGTTGCLAATYDRATHSNSVTAGASSSGVLRLHRILLPRGLQVTNISFISGTTALVTGSNQWFGLFDSARVVLAKTADNTSTAWAATTKRTLAVTSGPFVTTYAGWYYVGICVVASTVPTIQCFVDIIADNTLRNLAPIVSGNSTTGLTTPASCTGTQTAITVLAQLAYAEIS